MKKLVIVLLVAIIVLVVYSYWRNSTNERSLATSRLVMLETARSDWQTYSNPAEYRFTINYPNDFSVEEFQEQGGFDSVTGIWETNQGVKFKKNGANYFTLEVNNKIAAGGAPSKQTGSGKVNAINFVINKTKGFNFQTDDKTPTSYYVYYNFKQGSDNYRVVIAESTPQLRDQKEQAVDQILSTIKF